MALWPPAVKTTKRNSLEEIGMKSDLFSPSLRESAECRGTRPCAQGVRPFAPTTSPQLSPGRRGSNAPRFGASHTVICAIALGLLLSASVFGADAGTENGPIDWSRARAIHQKEVAGDKLSADDQAYLDRAKAAIARGEGPGRRPPGVSQADMQRARELNQKLQSGETLSADERMFLDGIRAKMQQRGGAPSQGAGPGSGKPAITNQESTGFVPLTQLKGDQKYKGVDGGLYGGGSNVPPEPLRQAAAKMSAKLVPLNVDGKPSPDGKVVLMSIGMSNTTMEFSKFKQLADADSRKSSSMLIVDAAQGGKDAPAWANVGATGTNPVWDEADRRLKSSGVTPQQVQAVWIKQAIAGPARFGDFPAHADELQKEMDTIIKLATTRYPNLRLVYLSSRIYGGYAGSMLNPERYAYEGAFAMRGVSLDQLKASSSPDSAKAELQSPVVLWGPYLWADGVKGREGDDLIYKREDLGQDGTHPSPSGRQKIAELLLKFFTSDPTATPWFVKSASQEESAKKTEAAASVAPPAVAHADTSWSRDDAAHLLRRAGFGGTPAQTDRVHSLGREAAVEYLVTGRLPAGAAAPFDHVELPELPTDLAVDYRFQGPLLQYKLQELRSWWIDRMVRSDRPLEEKMTLFWHGLFCSGVREVKSVQALSQQNDLFHREAIGNYKRLTADIIHDGAMIRYLNNDENQKGRPNENLARELMELFTMGEGNGYTEADIPEVARALTGMTVDRFSDTSQFIPARHDDGPKTIFGKTGKYTPDDVPELIFARPEPATYLARRLWEFFGTPQPAEQDVAAVAAALKGGDWELAPALRTLFNSPSFYGDACKFAVIKSPVELEAMTLRLLEEPPQPRMLWAASLSLRDMGEELFQPPNVKGWPGEDRWITSATLNTRYSIASAMAGGRLGVGLFPGMRPGFANAPPPGVARPAFSPGARPLRPGLAAATTQPAGSSAKTNLPPTASDARFARIQAIRQEQAEQVRAELMKMPPIPPASRMVVPSKLFDGLGAMPTAAQLVDAAAARFLQQPLSAKDKEALIKSLGSEPLSIGKPETDDRLRMMIGAMLATPQYQME